MHAAVLFLALGAAGGAEGDPSTYEWRPCRDGAFHDGGADQGGAVQLALYRGSVLVGVYNVTAGVYPAGTYRPFSRNDKGAKGLLDPRQPPCCVPPEYYYQLRRGGD